ncbi:Dot/Icm secretion system protein IcmQ [Coxiella burnetii]|uniref:Dot/Icm secretion system protein IcmQ n=1 Tax=Coxiella burnetii TaxID=777 RepID=UPI000163A4E4|nr:Dot/Icm secretion system protein IcmQ [Coxiella burnetii]AIT64056.1 IcmQ protein [Coxiella burnetii str. Namibia]ATN86546.1 type IV secretion protein IcmQ [Coxiella burnetii str. Schperling]EDR35504.1 IcmQ protein [Coxiella burnetii Q321]PHH56983.1 Dot/Icm secretion system protein IcmQ [Coxiella burnetii]
MTSFDLSNLRLNAKNEHLKQQLIECVDEQKAQFLQSAEVFYAKARRTEADYRHLCEAIIQATGQVLSAANWEESLFLRNTLKPIKKLYEEALALKEKLDGEQAGQAFTTPALTENKVKLYVSLYQSNGHDLKQWALQLASLESYMVGRPIYQNEADAIQAIRQKLSQLSEACVVVAVDQSKIISQENRSRKDRLGNLLTTVMPNAIKSENIIEFIHQGKRYHYVNQARELILKTSETN